MQLLMEQQVPSGVTGKHPLAALLTIVRRNRSIVSLYRTEQDEDGEIETRSRACLKNKYCTKHMFYVPFS